MKFFLLSVSFVKLALELPNCQTFIVLSNEALANVLLSLELMNLCYEILMT